MRTTAMRARAQWGGSWVFLEKVFGEFGVEWKGKDRDGKKEGCFLPKSKKVNEYSISLLYAINLISLTAKEKKNCSIISLVDSVLRNLPTTGLRLHVKKKLRGKKLGGGFALFWSQVLNLSPVFSDLLSQFIVKSIIWTNIYCFQTPVLFLCNAQLWVLEVISFFQIIIKMSEIDYLLILQKLKLKALPNH